MTLGNFVQKNRRDQKMTVDEVAIQSKLSVGTIRAIEQGRRLPSAEALHKVLGALNVDSADNWIDDATWRDPGDGTLHSLVPYFGANTRGPIFKPVTSSVSQEVIFRTERLKNATDSMQAYAYFGRAHDLEKTILILQKELKQLQDVEKAVLDALVKELS